MGHTKTFDNVTPEQIAFMKAALNQGGARIIVKSDSCFSVQGHGVVADANYVGSAQTLTVELLSKPILMPESFIFDKIQDALDNSAAAAEAK